MPLTGPQQCYANHFRRWKADLVRSRIQTTTQRESLRFLGLASNISSIYSDGRRTTKSKLSSHCFVSDEHLTDLCRDTLRSQDLSDQLYYSRTRRAVRYVQDFNIHFALCGFRGFPSLRIGQ